MFRFSDIIEIGGENKNVTHKGISEGEEVSENRDDTKTEYASDENPLKINRSTSNETTLVSEI